MKRLTTLTTLLLTLSTLIPSTAQPIQLSTHSTIYASDQSAATSIFELKAKTNLTIYGLDINVASRADNPIKVYTKPGSFRGYENDESAWELVLDSTVNGRGVDKPTPVLMEGWNPVVVQKGQKQSFYITFNGPYIRYSTFEAGDRMYYINHDVIIYGKGVAKRRGWDGGLVEPRVFNGGIKYSLGMEVVEVKPGLVAGLPTVAPTVSMSPTGSPTPSPTRAPTPIPTSYPTTLQTKSFTSTFTSDVTYSGLMFDIVAKQDVEIKSIGFNTYWTDGLNIQLWTRRGSYDGVDKDENSWKPLFDDTLVGMGLDVPTMIPEGSFRRIRIRRGVRQSFYISAPDGPYLRATKATWEGSEVGSNEHLIFYTGLGKRAGFEGFGTRNRIANSLILYELAELEPKVPEIKDGMETTSYEFLPTDCTYIQNGSEEDNSSKTQMLVDGRPRRITIMRFDLSALTLSPVVIKNAKLNLYAMTFSPFGGAFTLFPDGDFHQEHVTYANSPYSTVAGIHAGSLQGPIEEQTFYLKDLTGQFTNTIPKSLVIRIESDNENGVMYRSPAGNADNGPKLQMVLATDPSKASWIELFGSYAPTPAPTTDPEWDNPQTPSNPPRDYFNYNPRSRYGPNRWEDVRDDGWYERYYKLDANLDRNYCESGNRQSPQDLCEVKDECEEFHEPRTRAGSYGLGTDASVRPTPWIMHNKLRLSYKQRRSENDRPEPPGTDFAHNVFNSGTQDVIHIDIKVKSEHTLCGKRYDGEMQIYHLHQVERNLEATGLLIEVDDSEGRNPHFQKLLDYFWKKFDADEKMCQNRRLMARQLFDKSRTYNVDGDENKSKLRGLTAQDSDEMTMSKPSDQVQDNTNNNTFQSIANRFINLIQRQTAKSFVWNPYEPWYILRSIHFWAYSGSITEPPCFQGVNWRIIDVPIKITSGQLIQLQRLMFDHVDPDTCKKTSTHYEESNARPVQPNRGGNRYRCRRSDYVSDKERQASGKRKGFNQRQFWCGVKLLPWVEGEFPNV